MTEMYVHKFSKQIPYY